ncbi:hypothetical protein RSOLAG22IIIB_05761 [Rhizoctonia solani]|uniref:Uncharacterized protein n=1 Tax=Rhizoctonia solani TaxID=456999 RepID=A0A0K6G9P0_9AGAM|nr:hypothetical protein RSOLAG22IIIB_05761 [Rhizoctonia solani]
MRYQRRRARAVQVATAVLWRCQGPVSVLQPHVTRCPALARVSTRPITLYLLQPPLSALLDTSSASPTRLLCQYAAVPHPRCTNPTGREGGPDSMIGAVLIAGTHKPRADTGTDRPYLRNPYCPLLFLSILYRSSIN